MKKRSQKKTKILSVILPIFLILIVVGAALFFLQKPVLVPKSSLRFAIGTALTRADLVQEVQNGMLLDPDSAIPSDQAGTKVIVLSLRNRIGLDSEASVTVEFYAQPSPTVNAPQSAFTILAGEPVDLMEGVSATDWAGDALDVSISGEYDLKKAGVYSLFYVATDKAGSHTHKPFTLTVLASPFDENGKMQNGTYTTKTGHTLVIEDGIAYVDGYLIANKSYSLPKTYNPRGLTKETNDAFHAAQAAAKAAGAPFICKSGFRSWYDQDYIFKGYVRDDGLEKALTYSARPGHSEHQSGMGMDLVTSDSTKVNDPGIAEALQWLDENAYKYGLILRYPKGKSEITGYIYEPWHYRYVGKELAEILYNNGDWITMEEYFGIDSVYRGY